MRGPAVLAACLALAVRPAAAAPPPRWERAPAAVGAGAGSALATDESSGRLALGDERGVLLGESPGALRRVARHGPVRDLAFLPDATLLVATERGLFHLDREGRETDRSPAPGARARSVTRVAAAGGLVVAASAAGAFLSRDVRTWQRIDAGLPEGPADALALRSLPDGTELWIVIEGELWSALLTRAANGAPRAAVVRERPFDGAMGRTLRDVLLGSGDEDVLVLGEDALAVRAATGPGWRVLRPTLPPGAVAQRLARAAGWLWIATDRGLSFAAGPEGPWERAQGPAASQSVVALAPLGPRLFAAGDAGLLVAETAPPALGAGASSPRPDAAPAPGPPIDAVQRAALAYLALEPVELQRLRRGLGRRGWLPVLDVTLAADREDGRAEGWDQSFTSGDYRQLHDRDHDRQRDYAAALRLSWDLGDVAYNPEAIDVSREAREVIELRDDVLDEVNQLYYERRRALAELDAAQDPQEVERLRLRAAELAAGLDAWTGGWFARALAAPAPSATSPHPTTKGDRP